MLRSINDAPNTYRFADMHYHALRIGGFVTTAMSLALGGTVALNDIMQHAQPTPPDKTEIHLLDSHAAPTPLDTCWFAVDGFGSERGKELATRLDADLPDSPHRVYWFRWGPDYSVKTLKDKMKTVSETCADLAIAGHSMGGTVALHAVADGYASKEITPPMRYFFNLQGPAQIADVRYDWLIGFAQGANPVPHYLPFALAENMASCTDPASLTACLGDAWGSSISSSSPEVKRREIMTLATLNWGTFPKAKFSGMVSGITTTTTPNKDTVIFPTSAVQSYQGLNRFILKTPAPQVITLENEGHGRIVTPLENKVVRDWFVQHVLLKEPIDGDDRSNAIAADRLIKLMPNVFPTKWQDSCPTPITKASCG